ncbi:hypothetical protein Tco_0814107, partial [Tanacetum coccineum]
VNARNRSAAKECYLRKELWLEGSPVVPLPQKIHKNLILQFMTEMKEIAFILQNIFERLFDMKMSFHTPMLYLLTSATYARYKFLLPNQ